MVKIAGQGYTASDTAGTNADLKDPDSNSQVAFSFEAGTKTLRYLKQDSSS